MHRRGGIVHPHPLRKQLIARGILVVVLSNSAIIYLANLPLRLLVAVVIVVFIVSSCFSSLLTLSFGVVDPLLWILMLESMLDETVFTGNIPADTESDGVIVQSSSGMG